MKKIVLFLLVSFLFVNGFSQVKKKDQEVDIISHQVQLGESVRMLSKKYMVDPSKIYKLNEFAVNGISEGMVLKIPVPKKEVPLEKEVSEKTEEIAQTIPVEEKTVIKETIKEPVKQEKEVTTITRTTDVNHTVLPKETLYSLSKKYNVSVDDIKMSNESLLKTGMKIGQVLKIPSTKILSSNETIVTTEIKPIAEKPVTEKPIIKSNATSTENVIKHKVEPKETLYSLSKKYNVTVDVIKEQNAVLLQNGLQIGQVLLIKKQ